MMLQSLLADRFALKVSFKTADLPVYALEVAKDGPKMKAVEISAFPPPGTQAPPGAHLPGIRPTGPNQHHCVNGVADERDGDVAFTQRKIGNRSGCMDETGLKGNSRLCAQRRLAAIPGTNISERFTGRRNVNFCGASGAARIEAGGAEGPGRSSCHRSCRISLTAN